MRGLSVQELVDLGLYHEIHVSQINAYKKCRWAHDWKYLERFYSLKKSKPLQFGSAMHKAYETFFNPDTYHEPVDKRLTMAQSAFVLETQTQRNEAIKEFGVFIGEDNQLDDYNERIVLGMEMLEYYANHVHPQEDKNYKPIYVEKSFAVPVANKYGINLWCKCTVCQEKIDNYAEHFGFSDLTDKGLPVVIEGKIDVLMEDIETGKYWIFDWKNVANIAPEHEWLELDEQLNIYLWAFNKLGLDMAGFQYHEQRKGFPAPPRQLEKSRNGCKFSVSKTQDTTYEIFLATVKELDTAAYTSGLYDDYLNFLKVNGIKYFERTAIRKSQTAIDITNDLIYAVASEMIDPFTASFPTPSKFGCRFCEFRQPCIEKRNGNDPKEVLDMMYEIRPHYYNEVADTDISTTEWD